MRKHRRRISATINSLTCIAAFMFTACLDSGALPDASVSPLHDAFELITMADRSQLPNQPTEIRFIPGRAECIVLGKAGQIRHYRVNDKGAEFIDLLRIPDVPPAPGEIGLTGAVFSPNFAIDNALYICYTTGDNQYNRVDRLTWQGSMAEIEASRKTILQVDRGFPDEPQHAVYGITFGADGMLYVAMGDAVQPENAQDTGSLLGKLLRIRPSDGGYEIPADNPYLGIEGAQPEIAAIGLRTPWRISSWQDKVYIADVGENSFEEIEMYELARTNFGWPVCEGYCSRSDVKQPVFTVSHADPYYQSTDPQRSQSHRASIAVGPAYNRPGSDPYQDQLDGRLLIFDVFQGYVLAAEIAPDGRLSDEQHIFHFDFITGMDVGPGGHLYAISLVSPRLVRIALKSMPR